MANAFTDNKEHCDGRGVLVPHSLRCNCDRDEELLGQRGSCDVCDPRGLSDVELSQRIESALYVLGNVAWVIERQVSGDESAVFTEKVAPSVRQAKVLLSALRERAYHDRMWYRSQLDRIRAENDQQRQENDRLRLGLEEIDERLSELEGLSPEYVEDEIIEIRAMILDLLEGAKT